MSDRVKWFEAGPDMWEGRVDGVMAYIVLPLEPSDTMPHGGAWVSRAGVRNGLRMTNIERAKDIAEMQETTDPRMLHDHGLLLSGQS